MIQIVWRILHDLMPASMSDHLDTRNAEIMIILLAILRQAKSVK